MKTLGNITRYIEATSSRLDDLAVRARSVTDVGRPLVQESLIHLASTLEELRVSEEELRSQADTLAASRSDIEAELRRYRDLFQQAPVAYLATDSEGVVREVNHAAAAMLGARTEYLAGKPLAVFVHEEDRRGFRRQLAWVRETGRLAGWQMRLVSRSGAVMQLEASVSAAAEGNGGVELRWVLRESAARPASQAAPTAQAPMEPAASPMPQALPVEAEPADPHRMADPAWCEALLEEAGRTVNPASRSSAERLAGLFRGSLSLALYLGLLRPGDRIPGIREVSRATALNHKTVARAYRTLQKEGVLEVRDRSGVYVAALGWTDRRPTGDTETWAAEMLTEAWRRRIGIPALPEVVRGLDRCRAAALRLRGGRPGAPGRPVRGAGRRLRVRVRGGGARRRSRRGCGRGGGGGRRGRPGGHHALPRRRAPAAGPHAGQAADGGHRRLAAGGLLAGGRGRRAAAAADAGNGPQHLRDGGAAQPGARPGRRRGSGGPRRVNVARAGSPPAGPNLHKESGMLGRGILSVLAVAAMMGAAACGGGEGEGGEADGDA